VNVDNVQAMRIFLTGVGCVGKTTVGRELATLLNVAFFDLDYEIEQLFGTSIERLQEEFL
jgi:shikimate kinase